MKPVARFNGPSGWSRRVGGFSLLALGALLLVLPGPGIPLVLAGLALLAPFHPWARSLLEKLRARLRRLSPSPRGPKDNLSVKPTEAVDIS